MRKANCASPVRLTLVGLAWQFGFTLPAPAAPSATPVASTPVTSTPVTSTPPQTLHLPPVSWNAPRWQKAPDGVGEYLRGVVGDCQRE